MPLWCSNCSYQVVTSLPRSAVPRRTSPTAASEVDQPRWTFLVPEPMRLWYIGFTNAEKGKAGTLNTDEDTEARRTGSSMP